MGIQTKWVGGLLTLIILLAGLNHSAAQEQTNSGELAFIADGFVSLMDVNSGVVKQLAPHTGDTYTLLWSPDGNQLLFVSGFLGFLETFLVDIPTGSVQKLAQLPGNVFDLSWSPDGSQVAFGALSSDSADIFILNLADGALIEVAPDDSSDHYNPVWSPDGSQLAFVSLESSVHDYNDNGEVYLFEQVTGSIHELEQRSNLDYAPVWSPDGRYLALMSHESAYNELSVFEIATKTVRYVESGTNPRVYNQDGSLTPQWSSDGNHIAFVSERDGTAKSWEIYVLDAGTGNTANVSQSNGIDSFPVWSADGKYVAFVSQGNGQAGIHLVDTQTGIIRRFQDDDTSAYYPAWLANGMYLAFLSLKPDPDYPKDSIGEISLLDVAADDVRALTTSNDQNVRSFAWRPLHDE